MTDFVKLKAVLDGDVPTFGALNDADAATELNASDKSHNLPAMTGKQVKDLIDVSEWNARADAEKQLVLTMCGRDDLDPFGIDAQIFQDAMAGATATLAALNSARTITTSTAFINGLGTVSPIDVTYARALG